MIPILFESTEIQQPAASRFTKNGLGVLTDTTKCIVTEVRNGSYECEFSYPITGIHYSEISPDRIIKAKASEYAGNQLFRIYRAAKPINGIVKFYAQHISYDLNTNPVIPFEGSGVNATTALTHMLSHCYYAHNFTGVSTIETTADFKVTEPKSARNCLGGSEGSILDNYGGEYEFDNFTIKLHGARGQDNGVTILYGKNLTDITSDINVQATYTSICPYAKDQDGNLTVLPEKVIELQSHSDYGEPRTLVIDLSDKFETDEEITVAKLRQYANAYATGNKIDGVHNNIEISFAQLWQAKEYQTISLLERVGLCDTVTVKYQALGIAVKAKVIKTVYNTLTEKYEKMELGDARSVFGDSFISANATHQLMEEYERTNKSAMERAIENATALITGQNGGYVVLNQNDSTGEPFEILIMNEPDIQTATKMWRWNLGGLGYSSTGYNGPYGTAITMDGSIVANYITTGVLNASLIKTGVIEDEAHTNYWNMVTGDFRLSPSNTLNSLTNDGEIDGIYMANGELRVKATNIKVGILQDSHGKNLWNLNTGEFRLSTDAKVDNGASTLPTFSSYIANTAASQASSAVSGAMTQQNVFNALTNNGQLQGIYMQNNNLYINGTYIKSGIVDANLITTGHLSADRIQTGLIESVDQNVGFDLDNGEIYIKSLSAIANRSMKLNDSAVVFYKGNSSVAKLSSASANYSIHTITISSGIAVEATQTRTTDGVVTVGDAGIASDAIFLDKNKAIAFYDSYKRYLDADILQVQDAVIKGSLHLELNNGSGPLPIKITDGNQIVTIRFMSAYNRSGEPIRVLGYAE